jgi:perosamine synthetase
MVASDSSQYKVPFSGVGYKYSDADISVVVEAMRTGSTLTQGENQVAFETKFAEFVSVPHAFAVSSAAAALELAAVLAQVGPGDEVICPAHTYVATAYPFARHGARLRWADIDPDTFLLSAESIKSLMSPRTKVVIAVHLYGLPVDLAAIRRICDEAGVMLVEDCAQSIGATFDGAPTGSFGDLAVFSFQSHKNISTLGEGGMLVVRDEKLASLVPGLRHNGHRKFDRVDNRYWHPAMSNVDFDIPGVWPHNFCLGEPQAALGAALLDRVEKINGRRRERYFKARHILGQFPELVFQDMPVGRQSAHHLLPFRYDGAEFGAGNHDFMERLVSRHGVQPATQYFPLNRYGLFATSASGHANVPNTDRFFDNMVSLPFHVWMEERDFDYVLEATSETASFLRKHGGPWFAGGAA